MAITRRLFLQSTSLTAIGTYGSAVTASVVTNSFSSAYTSDIGFIPLGNEEGSQSIASAQYSLGRGPSIEAGTRVRCSIQALTPGRDTPMLPPRVAVKQRFCPTGCSNVDVVMLDYRRHPVESGSTHSSMENVVPPAGLEFTVESTQHTDHQNNFPRGNTTSTFALGPDAEFALREGTYLIPLTTIGAHPINWRSYRLIREADNLVMPHANALQGNSDEFFIAITIDTYNLQHSGAC
jgi:hypothetical protein